MASDYQTISRENTVRYGTDVHSYGQDFADRYTERTHFLYELLQNAEDALRWRRQDAPPDNGPRSVTFRLFADRLEVSHFGLLFREEHVRAICSIKRGTKSTSLTDIGKFGIGFKSVFAYAKRPEVHSGDEHFAISRFVHPEAVAARTTKSGETLFYIPFDGDEVTPQQAHAEISARLTELGFRTLLFLTEIESVQWEGLGGRSGSYRRRTRTKKHWKEVTLTGKTGDTAHAVQRWLVFSRDVFNPVKEPAGQVEVAFLLGGSTRSPAIVRADDSALVVFFPTEKETHCGFLLQGPYKTTPGRDNIPHDNKWNAHLIDETAMLVGETLVTLGRQNLASVGLLESLPLFRSWEMPEKWMFSPIYDVIVETLTRYPLIPAARGRFVAAQQARFGRGKGLIELFQPEQLTYLLQAAGSPKLQWVCPKLSESGAGASGVSLFLRHVLHVPELDAEQLVAHLDESFFERQSDRWMLRFYRFLLDHERLWRRGGTQGPGILLHRPFIRVNSTTHVTPFEHDGTPNVYLPCEEVTGYASVQASIANSKIGADFFRKLGLTIPDITAEVLHRIVPQYESETIDLTDEEHAANLQKILRAMDSKSTHQPELMRQLTKVYFLQVTETGTEGVFYARPCDVYFRTPALEAYFDDLDGVYFLQSSEPDLSGEKVVSLLKELGVAERPRLERVTTAKDSECKAVLRGHTGWTTETFINHDLHGLTHFLRRQRKATAAESARRARILWDFLIGGMEAARQLGQDYFQGTYEWKYYQNFSKKFAAHFLEVLRVKPWLPGRDGKLHRPSELLPRELPAGFTRHAGLCEILQLKADLLVELARKAGLRVEDLVFIRDNREEFDSLKRNVKQRDLPEAMPTPAPNAADDNGAQPSADGDHARNHSSNSNGNGERRTSAGDDHDQAQPRSPTAESSQDGSYATYIYVSAAGGNAETQARNSERSQERTALGALGVEAVLISEREQDRLPQQMPQTHEGYDIESRNVAGEVERYIEVKTIRTSWGERGVTLTSAQFEAARIRKGAYWLYVVENPNTPEQHIYRIWNPGELAQWYVFDLGWRALAEPDLIAEPS